MLLELKNVNKTYKLGNGNMFNALKDVNVSFNQGELVAIIGESGSGKSTLMNLIGGLDLSFNGEMRIDGKDIKGLQEKDLDLYRKNKIGFIFQFFNLIPHLNVLDNVTMTCILSNESKKERTKKARGILAKVGLEEHMYKKPNQLSGGQMQRVAIARALINDPDIILADEPTGALDSNTSKQILDIIQEIANDGKLVIMVTHSEKVAKAATRVITISDGMIIKDKINKIIDNISVINKNTLNTNNRLSFISSVKLALKNVNEKKARNILVSIGSSIGIMSVILMLSFGNGVEKYMTNTMNGYVNPLVVEVNKKPDNSTLEIPAPGATEFLSVAQPFDTKEIKDMEKINNVNKVEEGYTITSMNTNIIKYDDKAAIVMMLGTVSSNITSENILAGSMPKTNEILIDEVTRDKLGEDIIGKEVILDINFDKKNITGKFVVSGIYGGTSTKSIAKLSMIYVNYDDLKRIAGEEGFDLQPTTLYLVTDNSKYTNNIKTTIEKMGYQGSKQEQMLHMFVEMIGIVSYVLTAVSGISLVVSAIMILVVLYISVIERTKEIGTLKAIGAPRRDIKKIFTAEAFLIGLTSGLLGIILAYFLGLSINQIIIEIFDISVISVKLSYVLFGLGVSLLISIVAGFYPASKAAKMDPVVALKRE